MIEKNDLFKGPGKAWYKGYMTNFKGDQPEFHEPKRRVTPVETETGRISHESMKSVNATELPRPQSASEMRNVFVNNQLDQIQSTETHESQAPQGSIFIQYLFVIYFF